MSIEVLRKRVCKKKIIIIARCSDQNKFFLLCTSESSYREAGASAIEVAWKKQKTGYGAEIMWAKSYNQVNTEKERDS